MNTPNYNYSSQAQVTAHEDAIRELIAQLPEDEQLAELIVLRDNLTIQQVVAADCRECHLEMLKVRLEIVVSR